MRVSPEASPKVVLPVTFRPTVVVIPLTSKFVTLKSVNDRLSLSATWNPVTVKSSEENDAIPAFVDDAASPATVIVVPL